MNKETLSEIHFEQLTSPQIIGLIQLLTDINQISEDQRNGYYMNQVDRRMDAFDFFETLTKEDIIRLLKHFKRLDYID